MNFRALLLRGDLRRLRLALLDLFDRKELPGEIRQDLDAALTAWMLADPGDALEFVRNANSFEALALLRSLSLLEQLGSEGSYEKIWRSPEKASGFVKAHNLAIRGLISRCVLDEELAAEFRRGFVSRVSRLGYMDAFERALENARHA